MMPFSCAQVCSASSTSVEMAASRKARSVGNSNASVPTDTIRTPPKPLEIPKPKAPEPIPVAPPVVVEAPPPPPQLNAPIITPNATTLALSPLHDQMSLWQYTLFGLIGLLAGGALVLSYFAS